MGNRPTRKRDVESLRGEVTDELPFFLLCQGRFIGLSESCLDAIDFLPVRLLLRRRNLANAFQRERHFASFAEVMRVPIAQRRFVRARLQLGKPSLLEFGE